MKQPTLQEHYNSITKGKGNKKVFLNEAKRMFPNIIRNASDFEETSQILKDKHIITECNIIGIEPIGNFTRKTEEWEDAFQNFLTEESKTKEVEDSQLKGYDLKNKKDPNNMIFEEYKNGIYFESKQNPDKTIDEIKKIVEKNLAKDPLYYMNNAAFGVKDLGYTKEAPGLGEPKEPKGKHKSSGYGTLSENIDKIKKELDSLGVKYELGNKFKPFKTIHKPIDKDDDFYEKFDDIIDLNHLQSAVKSVKEDLTKSSIGPMHKPEGSEFKQGDTVKCKGLNHKIERIEGDRIYIKNIKYPGRPSTWVKAQDLTKSKLKEEIEEEKYLVIRKGGSVGEKPSQKEFNSKEEAKEYAKRMNKQLSSGEKSYYKIKYIIVSKDSYEKTPHKYLREGFYSTSSDLPESGLIVRPKDRNHLERLRQALDNSDLYGEQQDDYFFFPEEEETYDALETEIQNLLDENDIQAEIEGVWNENLNENKVARIETFQDAVEYAQRISKEEGVVQHIEETPQGDYKIVDWYDADKTIMSFENGRELNEIEHNDPILMRMRAKKDQPQISKFEKGQNAPQKHKNLNENKMIKLTSLLLENSKKPQQQKKQNIKDHIKDIEKRGSVAALEAKIGALDEEISNREQKLSMVTENEDLAEFVNQSHIKEIQREIKELGRAKEKYQKLYERVTGKAYTKPITEELPEENLMEEQAPDNLKKPGDKIRVKADPTMDLAAGFYTIEDVVNKDGEWIYILDNGTEYAANYIQGTGGYWKDPMVTESKKKKVPAKPKPINKPTNKPKR